MKAVSLTEIRTDKMATHYTNALHHNIHEDLNVCGCDAASCDCCSVDCECKNRDYCDDGDSCSSMPPLVSILPVGDKAVGVKGSDVYTLAGVGNDLVALNALLVRGADETTVGDLLRKALGSGDRKQSEVDAFVLAFMTRAVRGGKGERDLFYLMYQVLLKERQALALDLLDLVGHYGYWGDLFTLGEKHKDVVWKRLVDIVLKQVGKDKTAAAFNLIMDPTSPKQKLSLLAKWMPREGKPLATELAMALWLRGSGSNDVVHSAKLRAYRKTVADLNKALQTTEIAMCAGDWEEIKPSSVPGRCLKQNRLAFLNEVAPTKKDQRVEKGKLRHPDDEVRMACREHFQEHFKKTASGEVVSKGAHTIYPHEVIRQVSGFRGSLDEKNSLTGMWKAFVAKAVEGGGLGRSIPMCDFSGSMQSGGLSDGRGVTPLEVSRAMGLLISEVTTEEFRGRMLTFDSVPRWLEFRKDEDIFARVEKVNRSGYGQGLSTDFQKAMDLVLGELKRKRVVPGREPENLIVLTDMAWDAACGSDTQGYYTSNSYRNVVKTAPWQTHIQMIRESFKRAGEDMFGEGNGYTPPRIVIWNISASCQDMHAKASEEGVVMLSGWSPSLFKVLMARGVEVQTPEQALRVQLADPIYDLVRQRIAAFRAVG